MTSVSGSGERILAILDLFAEDSLELTPEEMMERLGYSRPTLYRYLKTLKDAGFLVSLPGEGFSLGPRFTELDYLLQRSDRLIAAGRPMLGELAESFPCSAFLVRWYGNKILCVASEVSEGAPVSSYARGRPMPLGKGAVSRAILAHLPKAQLDRFMDDLFPGNTADPARQAYLDQLRAVRRAGVATATGEVTPGVFGTSAPVFAARKTPIGALCLTIRATGTDAAMRNRIAARVAALAGTLSATLGAELTDMPDHPALAS